MDLLENVSVAKDLISTINDVWKKSRQTANDDGKEFHDKISNTIKETCNSFQKKYLIADEYKDIDMWNDYGQEIERNILISLNEEKELSIKSILPQAERIEKYINIFESELLKNLKMSFEFTTRKELKEIHEDVKEIENNVSNFANQVQNYFDEGRKKYIYFESITREYINRMENEAKKNVSYRKAYYAVNDRQDIVAHAICCDCDVVNRELLQQLVDMLCNGNKNIFLVGKGGAGKTSLLFRTAIEIAKKGYCVYWTKLQDINVTSNDMEGLQCFLTELQRKSQLGQDVFLFMDNLYLGRKWLKIFKSIWKKEYKFRIVCAERVEHISNICNSGNNLLSPWIENSKFICLLTKDEISKSVLRNYSTIDYQVPKKYKLCVLREVVKQWEEVDKKKIDYSLKRIEEKLQNVDIPIAEMILSTRILCSSDKNLDDEFETPWASWEQMVDQKFQLVNSYRWIATFSQVRKGLLIDDFANFYGLNVNVFSDLIRYTYEKNIYTPYQIVEDGGKIYLKTTHDIIPSMFFEFYKELRCGNFDENVTKLNMFICDKQRKLEVKLAVGDYYFDNNEYDKVKKVYWECLDKENNLDMGQKAKVEKRLSAVFRDTGEYNDAIECGQNALNLFQLADGDYTFSIAMTWNDIGLAYQYSHRYEQGLECFETAKKMLEDNKETGKMYGYVLNSMGLAKRSLNAYAESIDYFIKAKEVLISELGSTHEDIAMVYNNMAGSYLKIGNYEESIIYYKKALKIRIKRLGEQSPYVATTYLDMGNYYYETNKYRSSIIYANRAIKGYRRSFDEQHHDIGAAVFLKGKVYSKQGKIKDAMKCFQQVEKILKGYEQSDFFHELKEEMEKLNDNVTF